MKCVECGFRPRKTAGRECWENEQKCSKCYYKFHKKPVGNRYTYRTQEQNKKVVELLKEYVEVMSTEPDKLIPLSKVHHDLRRILADE